MNLRVPCPSCQEGVADEFYNQPGLLPCPYCSTPIQVEVFPAQFRKISPGQAGEAVLVDGESSCFFHPQKKAVRPCDSCGRFVCALCDCELHHQHYCPACLESGKTKGKIQSLETQRTLYDGMALSLAIYPMLIFYFTLITAPITLFIAIRYWKAPPSLVPRHRKTRLVAAIILASLQLLGWGLGFFFLASNHS